MLCITQMTEYSLETTFLCIQVRPPPNSAILWSFKKLVLNDYRSQIKQQAEARFDTS